MGDKDNGKNLHDFLNTRVELLSSSLAKISMVSPWINLQEHSPINKNLTVWRAKLFFLRHILMCAKNSNNLFYFYNGTTKNKFSGSSRFLSTGISIQTHFGVCDYNYNGISSAFLKTILYSNCYTQSQK